MTWPARYPRSSRQPRRHVMTGALALCLLPGLLPALLTAAQASQPGGSCAASIDAIYGWRGEIGAGRLALTSAHVADFATLSPAPGIDAWGGFDLTLVAERGLDEIRITPPQLAFGGVHVTPSQWDEIDLAIVVGEHVIDVTGPPRPDYVITGPLTELLRTDRARPVGTVALHLTYQGRHVVTGRINAARLEAGMSEWDRQRAAARATGCLPA